MVNAGISVVNPMRPWQPMLHGLSHSSKCQDFHAKYFFSVKKSNNIKIKRNSQDVKDKKFSYEKYEVNENIHKKKSKNNDNTKYCFLMLGGITGCPCSANKDCNINYEHKSVK